jgi:hypothetical protein
LTLIDTCASVSVTSIKNSKTFKLPDAIRVNSLGGIVKIDRRTLLTISIENIERKICAYYLDTFKNTLLLGNDVLVYQLEPIINYKQSFVQIDNIKFPFFLTEKSAKESLLLLTEMPQLEATTETRLPVKVIVRNAVTIPGNSFYDIDVEALSQHRIPVNTVLELDSRFSQQLGLLAHDIFIPLNSSDTIQFRVHNTLPRRKRVPAGTVIGHLFPVQEVYEIIEESDIDFKPRRPHIMTSDQLKSLKINPNLNAPQRQDLINLLSQFGDVFGWEDRTQYIGDMPRGLRLCDIPSDVTPIAQRPYRYSLKEREYIRDKVEEMKRIGVIRESQSPWSSPVVITKKQDGSHRFCCDFRKVNKLCKYDPFPMPHASDMFEALHGVQYMSLADIRDGFWAMLLEEEDVPYTAFCTQDGHYEWITCPFGMRNSMQLFLRLINYVFRDYAFASKEKFIFMYVDDIVVHSQTWNSHLAHLRKFLLRLRKVNLSLKPSKCTFGQTQIKLLGYLINPEGILVDPDKITALTTLPSPKCTKDVRSFLGLASFYRKYVKGFAQIAAPLHYLTGEKVPFIWSEDCELAFKELKSILSRAPILKSFDPGLPTELWTDASSIAIAAILQQRDSEGGFRVIAYASRLLHAAERNYATTHLECLAIVWGLEHFRVFCFNSEIKVVTDHHALCSLLNLKRPTGRLARWLMTLSDYTLEIHYTKGESHPTDCLSRNIYAGVPEETEEVEIVLYAIEDDFRHLLVKKQMDDPNYTNIISELKDSSIDTIICGYLLRQDTLYYRSPYTSRWLLAVPRVMISQILYCHHTDIMGGHQGVSRTLRKIQNFYHWPNMRKDVLTFVRSCITCGKIKSRYTRPPGFAKPLQIPPYPWHTAAFDLIGPLRPSFPGTYIYIAVCVDQLTRYAVAQPLRTADSDTIARFFINQICFVFGAPKDIVLDNASINRSHLFEAVTKGLGSSLNFSSPYAHSTNLCERFNRSIENVLAAYVNQSHSDWHIYLPACLYSINASVHEATGFSAHYLIFGKEPRTPLEAVFPVPDMPSEYIERVQAAREITKTRLLAAQEQSREAFDARHSDIKYSEGDLVMVGFPNINAEKTSKKLNPKSAGPYKIIKQFADLNYKVQLVDGDKKEITVSVRRLKPYTARPKELEYTPKHTYNLMPPVVPHTRIEELPDPHLPDSVAPVQSIESVLRDGYRTRYGRFVQPPQKSPFN